MLKCGTCKETVLCSPSSQRRRFGASISIQEMALIFDEKSRSLATLGECSKTPHRKYVSILVTDF
jgi:hypothetical protein